MISFLSWEAVGTSTRRWGKGQAEHDAIYGVSTVHCSMAQAPCHLERLTCSSYYTSVLSGTSD